MSASYDAAYGVFLGPLSSLLDGDVEGKAYIVNDTTLQLVNFTFNGKASGRCFLACCAVSSSLRMTLSKFALNVRDVRIMRCRSRSAL